MEKQVLALMKVLLSLYCWESDKPIEAFRREVPKWWKIVNPFLSNFRFPQTMLSKVEANLRLLAKGAPVSGDAIDLMEEFSQRITSVIEPRLNKELDLDNDHLKYVKVLCVWLRKFSANADSQILKFASKVDPLFANSVLVDEHIIHQSDIVPELVAVVEQLTGTRGVRIPSEMKDSLRADQPLLWERYLALNKALVTSSKQALRSYVRSHGTDGLADYQQMKEDFKAARIFNHWPDGFEGKIDDDGNFYTSDGVRLAANPTFKVTMNPNYDEDSADNGYYCTALAPSGTQYIYTVTYRKVAKEQKFEAVEDFIPKLNHVRAAWVADMIDSSPKTQVLATLLELMYWTVGRIGSLKGETEGKPTIGISVLKKENFTHFSKERIEIQYRGKSGVHQHHILVPKTREEKLCYKALAALLDNKEDEDYVFSIRGNVPPSNSTVNNYLRSKGAGDLITVHKIRHAKGTVLMRKMIAKCPLVGKRNVEQQRAESWYKEAALDVGKLLGHVSGEKPSWSTAVGNYIEPQETVSFFLDKCKVRLPSWAVKLK